MSMLGGSRGSLGGAKRVTQFAHTLAEEEEERQQSLLYQQQASANGASSSPHVTQLLAWEAAGGMEGAPPDVDWSILEEVAAHVSRTSLAGMQQLWKTHANSMDIKGKAFASQVYGIHSQVVRDMASMKTFELKPIINLVNGFTSGVREIMLDVFAQMRESDNEFAQQIYQATRRTFVQNLKQALDARDAWHQEKLKGVKVLYEESLARARGGAAQQVAQQETQFRAEIARLEAELEWQRQQAAAAAAAAVRSGASTSAGAPAGLSGMLAAAGGTSSSLEVAGSSAGAGPRPSQPGDGARSNHEPPASSSSQQGTPRQANAEGQVPRSPAPMGPMASAQIEELKAKLEGISSMLAMEREETVRWRSKWAQESTKTDGVKRECMQIVLKCEEHARELQQKHMAELSQRDYILKRCKDTIINLEQRVTDLSGSPPFVKRSD